MATKFLYPLFVKIFSLLVLVSLALVPFGAALAAQNNNENIVPPPLSKTKNQPFGINPRVGDFSPRLITSSASFTGPTVAIPDFTPAGVCILISISTTGTITDVRLTGVALAHTWSGDLRLDLYHPGGTYLTVLNRAPAGPTTTWSNLIATSPLNFYDSAATSAGLMGDLLGNNQFICQDNGLCDYSPNPDGYPGSVANFAAFNGLNPNGNWQLCVSDNGSGDIGSISAFTLQVSTSTQPTVTITSTETSPTNKSPIPLTITFNSIVTGFSVGDITVGNGTATNFAGSGTTYTVDITPSSSGVVTVDVLQNVAFDLGNTGNTAANQFSIELDTTTPTVFSHTLQANYSGTAPSNFTVTFSEDVYNPAGNTDTDDVTNPNNYVLVEQGTVSGFQTTACNAINAVNDTRVTPSGVTYIPNTAIVNLGSALPTGSYRLFVCGTTSIVDPANNPLNGGVDFTFDFTVGAAATATESTSASALPKTGFAPSKVTTLPAQPATLEYAKMGDLWLEIPSLNVKSNIVGVPQNADKTWDVTWLGNDTGWLNGTAFPTWTGNSVLTAHVTNASGLEGPFAALKSLKYGDQIIVHMGGAQYIYEVRNSRLARPYSTSFAFESKQDASYLTLITCQGYSPFNDSYLFRRVVRAVLIEVK